MGKHAQGGRDLKLCVDFRPSRLVDKRDLTQPTFILVFREIPLILKRFWPAYIFAWTLVIGMIVMSLPFLPDAIRVTSMTAILPSAIMAGCHILVSLRQSFPLDCARH